MKKMTQSLLYLLTLSSSLFASTLSNEIKNSSLIVYNSNIGLVHEERALDIKTTDTNIIYEDVAQTINTDSVNVTLDDSISLLSQQYRFDKLTQYKLLQANIDKKVEVRLLRNKNEFKIITGTLLSTDGVNSIVRTTNYSIITVKSSDIILSEIPNELITKPSLVWNVDVTQNIKTDMKLDYIISKINFKSDYILNIDGNSSTLTGWITVENRSGKKFVNTELSLLAGDINRIHHERPIMYKRAMSVTSQAEDVPHQSFEGYHFYTIPFKVTLANNEKTQIKFLTKSALKVQRSYSVQLNSPLYVNRKQTTSVNQYVSLKGLDVPLPKGTLRTYSKLQKRTILLGENRMAHTPKNTPIKLKIGKNFDLKASQTVTHRNDSKTLFDADILYSIRNSSNENKNVTLLVPFNRQKDSEINTDKKYTFTDANLVTFEVEVKANSTEEFKVNYKSSRR